MTETTNPDPRTLSFSQANGYEDLPQPLALEEVSYDARRKLWDLLWLSAWEHDWDDWATDYWPNVFQTLHLEFMKEPLDEFDADADVIRKIYRPLILSDLSFHILFDLWQMIMRHRRCPKTFVSTTAAIFEECRLAYVVDTTGPPTILPAATPQEGEALIAALRNLKDGGYLGAETHLREAGTQINAGEWAESVRESIHAVESVARVLDPQDTNTLDDALKSLEKQIRIHPALKGAFSRLYGYTSDETGIRHSLLEDDTSPVGRDEAVFMLGACASFVTYLLSKRRAGVSP